MYNTRFILVILYKFIQIRHFFELVVLGKKLVHLLLHRFQVFDIFDCVLSLEIELSLELHISLIQIAELLVAVLKLRVSNRVVFEELLYLLVKVPDLLHVLLVEGQL